MDRSRITYRTQDEFSQLDITTLDHVLNSIHFHRSRLDGQEVFAMQARAVLTHGRNRPPEPAPRPQPNNNPDSDNADDVDDNVDQRCDGDPSSSGESNPHREGGADPGAARSKQELRDAERRAFRLADYPEIAEALASGHISTVQADLISRAKVSTRTKLELLADAKHEHADQTAEAVKAAVIEADTETADDRLNRQRGNRRGGCGVNDDGMYWLSLLIDPVTGALIKHAYDPRFRTAWAKEKELDFTVRRVPKQLAGDIIANMLLGLPAINDLHPQAQAEAHQPTAEPERAESEEPVSQFGDESEHEPEPVRAKGDIGAKQPTESDDACSTCRSSGPPPAKPSKSVRARGRPRADVNVVIGLSDLNDLADRAAVGYTSDGVAIPATLVRTLMCDAEISFWIEQADSQQLKLARTARYATPVQHRALLVRDGSCVWKHCTMPASASEAHHITFWEHGGNTNLEQLCLLCPAHHRKLHAMGAHIRPGTQQREWRLTRDSDNQTIKQWTNPPHRQKPGTNTNPVRPRPQHAA